jgi:hypothetical protein
VWSGVHANRHQLHATLQQRWQVMCSWLLVLRSCPLQLATHWRAGPLTIVDARPCGCRCNPLNLNMASVSVPQLAPGSPASLVRTVTSVARVAATFKSTASSASGLAIRVQPTQFTLTPGESPAAVTCCSNVYQCFLQRGAVLPHVQQSRMPHASQPGSSTVGWRRPCTSVADPVGAWLQVKARR